MPATQVVSRKCNHGHGVPGRVRRGPAQGISQAPWGHASLVFQHNPQSGYVLRGIILLAALCAVIPQAPAAEAPPVRIKDIATVSGTAGQTVMGYGLVVGLEGTGDSQKSGVTARALANMLEHFDLKIDAGELATENVAAVVVTTTLPASAREGDKTDVTVASVGDASSLYGAVLLPTPLRGNDSDVYALARGPVSIGSVSAKGGGQKVQRSHPVAARIVDGATIVQAIPPSLDADRVHFTLRQPDFTTATRIGEAINTYLEADAARAVAAGAIEVAVPADRREDLVAFIADLESLKVVGDTPARVVVNERTGTIIIGGDVRILPVAIAHGNLTITVTRRLDVSQPPPFSGGTTVLAPNTTVESSSDAGAADEAPVETSGDASPPAAKPRGATAPLPGPRTVVTPRTELTVTEDEASLVEVKPQTQLSDLVEALNSLGVKPRDMMAILQALKAANALQAELVLL